MRDDLLAQLRNFYADRPINAIAVTAAAVALASTPIAFALLGRQRWFQARRGRSLQRPSFAAVIVGMMLVMGVPAIFLALLVKSQYFDVDRYEFNPNRTLSVLDQGRQYEAHRLYESVARADEAVRAEQKRLAEERRLLVENVKKLDEAMLGLRAASAATPTTAQAIPRVLQALAGVRRSVGVDGPQQLLDFTAPPVAARSAGPAPATPAPAAAPTTAAAAPAPTPAAAGGGLGKAEIEGELATVPGPQRPVAAMLPLAELPAGWVVAKSGDKHVETFNAENLFEKIDGRAESFLQYDVKGMAYTYFHPEGDDSSDVQLYIFEMGGPLKALGKYGSEKPEDAATIPLGDEGYSTAGSTTFYAGKYYTQVVSTKDDPKFAAFALEIARRVAAKQKPAASPGPAAGGGAGPEPVKAAGSPEDLFRLLPGGPKKARPQFVPSDAFGYSFLSDVFMADYQEAGATWQGFLRSFESPEAARKVFDQYVENARKDGAQIIEVKDSGADRMIVSSNIGLVDAIFLKGNAVAGANGAPDEKRAESFARDFAKGLPGRVPVIEPEKKAEAPVGKD